MLLRRQTDAECVQRARKQVQWEDKWGKKCGLWLVLGGIAYLGAGVYLIHFIYSMVDRLNNLANPANPVAPVPNPAWPQAQIAQWQQAQMQGFWVAVAVGVVMGAAAGALFFQGGHTLRQGFALLIGGDRTSRLLVQYHDAIVEFMREEADRSREQSADSRVPSSAVQRGDP